MANSLSFRSLAGWVNYAWLALGGGQAQLTAAPWADQYSHLRAYYLSNGLYDILRERFNRIGYSAELVKPLRNPAYRVVEFYAAKLWPGPLVNGLPIVTTKGLKLTAAIEQTWKWSNWQTEKQAAARTFATCGDLFLKVATRTNPLSGQVERVYYQNLEPETVTEMDTDERSYLTYIRLDTAQSRRLVDGTTKAYTLTEVWSKDDQSFRRWEHEKATSTPINQLGDPTEEKELGEFGIDFIPVVWQPFRHIGQERGMAAITPAIDKIDEANRQATRLHQMLFRYNKPLWAASAGGNDASGRPLPPPRLGGTEGRSLELNSDPNKDDIITLPGNSTLSPLIPSINYSSSLETIRDQMADIRRDLPEMAYSELVERSDLSGVALRYMLEAAIDRIIEARGNADAAMVRAHEIALTIGSKAGLFGGLGSYEAGSFTHEIGPRPVLTEAESERAAIVKMYFDAGVPLPTAARRAGWTVDEIETMRMEKEAADQASQAGIAQAMLDAQEQFDKGPPVQDEEVEDEPTQFGAA